MGATSYAINNGSLYLYICDQSKPAVGCGYFFLITTGAMSHTAFRTKKALKTWLKLTGLKIGRRSGRQIKLIGNYTRNLEMSNMAEFYAKYGKHEPFYALDNGQYSIGFCERKETGNILHIQNPNTDRPVLDYFKVMKHLETGTPLNMIFK